eukprot:2539107-Prymnesium_polylepis.1
MQRRTAKYLLRPYPHGLRFSGKNMRPSPCWLVGAQCVALNMSNNDVSVQLHFALFNGFVRTCSRLTGVRIIVRTDVLKPFEMRVLREDDGDDFSSCHSSSRAFFIRRGTGGAGL